MSTKAKAARPIAIFDSGIGGLTVTQALVDLLPQENIIYFGDTAHYPYGDKSAAAIQSYAIKIAHFFLQQECKLILIACSTASAVAYDLLKEYVGTQTLVVNVIDPLVHWLKKEYPHKKLGLIGTKQTVRSNVYKKKIDELNVGIQLSSYPTSLLASAIEEFGNHDIIGNLLEVYLAHPSIQKIDALILGCTHYPVVKDKIAAIYKNKIPVIDSSEIVARAVKEELKIHNLLNTQSSSTTKQFYISDYIDSFVSGTKLFFDGDIVPEHYPLWD